MSTLETKENLESILRNDIPDNLNPQLITRLIHSICWHSQYYQIEVLVNDVIRLTPCCFISRTHIMGQKTYVILLKILKHQGLISREQMNAKMALLSKEQ